MDLSNKLSAAKHRYLHTIGTAESEASTFVQTFSANEATLVPQQKSGATDEDAKEWRTSCEEWGFLHSGGLGDRSSANKSVVDWVNPFIGTTAEGHTFPGATAPWGMVQATPWTRHDKYANEGVNKEDDFDIDNDGDPDWQSGFVETASFGEQRPVFLGMAHSSLSGAGTGELGELRIGPTGVLHLVRKNTTASPGYFATSVVDSMGNSLRVETAATTRGAIHRMDHRGEIAVKLGAPRHAYWGIYLAHGWHQVVSNRRVVGCTEHLVRGFGDAVALLCFVIEFDRPFVDPPPGPVSRAHLRRTSDADAWRSAPKPVIKFNFGAPGEVVVRVAVSRTDVDHAVQAFSEVDGRSLSEIHAETRRLWAKELSAVQAEILDCSLLTSFYTGLYHSMLGPTLLSNADGTYRLQKRPQDAVAGPMHGQGVPLDKVDQEMPEQRSPHQFYSSFSLWDTYRGLHPFMNLVVPERSREFADSLMAMYDSWGYLPKWPLFASPSSMMEGDPGTIVLAQMALQGVADRAKALRILERVRAVPGVDFRSNVTRWMRTQYQPEDVGSSRYTQQAIAEQCVSKLAAATGHTQVAKEFSERADYLAKLGSTKMFLTEDGRSIDPASDTVKLDEGTPMQYQWSLVYDLAKQEKYAGGADKYVQALDSFFHGDGYDSSNEVTMHVPYLYSAVGRPARTAERVDDEVKSFYTARPDGLPGNDDLGQMSMWLVLSVLGFYPVEPCSNEFVLGRPFVSHATMRVPGGNVTIRVHGQSVVAKKYIQGAKWNGQELSAPKLSFQQLRDGGLLEIWMTDYVKELKGIWALGSNITEPPPDEPAI
jgi:predicted alpha-1,2-mannosidase